jgi:peptidoglycan hydrolase-like protein with peptidoglycan-binding domain
VRDPIADMIRMGGTGTRQAIERFEQDKRLPVTGEFNARTVRELSSASGIAVQ